MSLSSCGIGLLLYKNTCTLRFRVRTLLMSRQYDRRRPFPITIVIPGIEQGWTRLYCCDIVRFVVGCTKYRFLESHLLIAFGNARLAPISQCMCRLQTNIGLSILLTLNEAISSFLKDYKAKLEVEASINNCLPTLAHVNERTARHLLWCCSTSST